MFVRYRLLKGEKAFMSEKQFHFINFQIKESILPATILELVVVVNGNLWITIINFITNKKKSKII